MNTTHLATQIPKHLIAKAIEINPPMPFNYTIGLTYRCQARCKTCAIYQRPQVKELVPVEWARVFKSLKQSPYWVTFTGGEPFLYQDLCEVYWMLVSICNPKQINIPTNGQIPDRITKWVWDMAKLNRETKLTVNVSIDHYIPAANDEIRGIKGYYENAVQTIKNLISLEIDNLEVGIHSVISTFNVIDFEAIHRHLSILLPNPNNYISEVAERRIELCSAEMPITPHSWQYRNAVRSLIENKTGHNLKQALRKEYYYNVGESLYPTCENKLPSCYAGYASCQITPDGEIWDCCMRAESMGNLRSNDFNFKKIWHSERASQIRKAIKDCKCPMANVNYSNMLMNFPSLINIIKRMI